MSGAHLKTQCHLLKEEEVESLLQSCLRKNKTQTSLILKHKEEHGPSNALPDRNRRSEKHRFQKKKARTGSRALTMKGGKSQGQGASSGENSPSKFTKR